ncbi:uncharacterized protein LOC126376409 [Pectinophora gossypiella]|uniref:uncharacterized protein LOC126376409 n=1 Tax=Pectinophora gossypiella TaxID=13191 RepID=UPI00214E8EB9|nr:uncharacterized protein LOC126376409 [Pectinophora gossypiella]
MLEKSQSRRKRVRVLSSSSESEHESMQPPPARRARRSTPGDRQNESSVASSSRAAVLDDDLVSVLYAERSSSSLRDRSTARAASPAGASSEYIVTPSASVEPHTVFTPIEPATENESQDVLDLDLMEILGMDPTQCESYGPEIQKDVGIRFEHYVTTGLARELRKELVDKHKIPINCKLVDAPALNPEMKAALTEWVVKRDKAIEMQQKLLACALSSLGEAITMVLALKDKQPDLLRLLIDTGRIICERQHNDSLTRRNYVLSTLKQDLKQQLKATKIGNLLFGDNLQETLKSAKAINKSGTDLKAPNFSARPKQNTNPKPGSSKNWKSSNENRKQTAAPKNRETAMTHTVTKNLRSNSSKTSQPQRSRSNRY